MRRTVVDFIRKLVGFNYFKFHVDAIEECLRRISERIVALQRTHEAAGAASEINMAVLKDGLARAVTLAEQNSSRPDYSQGLVDILDRLEVLHSGLEERLVPIRLLPTATTGRRGNPCEQDPSPQI